MSTIEEALRLYKVELIKEQAKNKDRLEHLRKCLRNLYISKGVILQSLNKEIRGIKSRVQSTLKSIEAHDTLIRETEDGTLESRDSD